MEVVMEKVPVLKYYRTHTNVLPPEKQTKEAACYDLHAHLKIDEGKHRGVTLYTPDNKVIEMVSPHKDTITGMTLSFTEVKVVIPPRHRAIIPTGIVFDIPSGYSVRLHPRSGLSIKKGFIVANCEGVIDSDYFHEIKALMVNNSDEEIIVEHGDRICQAELIKCTDHTILETFDEPKQKTNRIGGLGSTGISLKPPVYSMSCNDPNKNS